MGRIWRIVLTVVVFLVVAGLVLIGAAWLTGASLVRIEELVFGGTAGFEAWRQTALQTAQSLWDAVTGFFTNLF